MLGQASYKKFMILLSIIIPVYNVEDYVERCVSSVVCNLHRFKDIIEILIVDDGTTDNSIGKIFEYIDGNTIKLIKQENMGLGGARNTGIDGAKGIYLWFIDSDDYIEDFKIENLISILEKCEYDLVLFDGFLVDNQEKKVGDFRAFKSNELNINNLILELPAAWNKICKREIIINNSLYFPNRIWFEDLATMPAIISKCNSFYYYHNPIYFYRQRPDSIMRSKKLERNLEIIEAVSILKNRIGERYNDELEYLSVNHILLATTKRVLRVSKRYDIIEKLLEKTDNIQLNDNIYYKRLGIYNRLIYKLLKKRYYKLALCLIRIVATFKKF